MFKYSSNLRNIIFISVFLALACPAAVSAQAVSIHKFAGTVTVDGRNADGAIVTAFIDGSNVASSKTIRGRYTLSVVQPSRRSFAGKIISFVVVGEVAGNSFKHKNENTVRWKEGGSDTLNFSVKIAPQLTPKRRVKPIVTPQSPLRVKPTITPARKPKIVPKRTIKLDPKPTARPTLTPPTKPRGNTEREGICFDVKKYYGAPNDDGTIIRTLDRIPVSSGDAISLTGTTYYDGNSRVLRVFNDDELWGYLIALRWKGTPPLLKDNPARACVFSNATQKHLPDSTPGSSPKSPNKPEIDLAVFINSGTDREKIDLVCSGMSPGKNQSEIRCQVLNPPNTMDVKTRLDPSQWPIIVKNNGATAVSDYIVDIVLSSDLKAPIQYAPPLGPVISEDVLIEPGRLDNGPPLGTNGSAVVHVGIGPLPNGIHPGGYGLCAVVDPGNLILESNEANNVFCLPIEISEFSYYESGFSGTVLVDGNVAIEGAVIASYIMGKKISESEVTDGIYSLIIEQPQEETFEGKTVEFRLVFPSDTGIKSGGMLLNRTGTWEAGNIEEIDFKLAQKRGFLVNPPIGEIGSGIPWNNIDGSLLSIIGIILTLIAAGIPLFKGD